MHNPLSRSLEFLFSLALSLAANLQQHAQLGLVTRITIRYFF